METMVRDRLSIYLEAQHAFLDTMHRFRPNPSAQDVLLQLNREVIDLVEHPDNDEVVLALDLRGGFDNVKHDVVLTALGNEMWSKRLSLHQTVLI